MAGLFARPAQAGGVQRDAQRQAVFLEFKAVCVSLLDAARQSPVAKTNRTIVDLLSKLTRLIEEAPDESVTPALANYAFFPLASLLQPALGGADRGDLVLEATAMTLAALVPKWRSAGMEPRVRQELWIMVTLKLGGPLDPQGPKQAGKMDKGKAKAIERTEEAELALVRVLLALMRPAGREKASLGQDEDSLGEDIDWDKVDPSNPSSFDRPSLVHNDRPPPVPILFHTLTTLLTLAAEPTSLLQLQLSSLEALGILFATYLSRHDLSPVSASPSGPSPLLATALPGSASTLSRIAVSKPSISQRADQDHRRRQAIPVVVAALECLARLIIQTVGDGLTSDLRGKDESQGQAPPASLEELVFGQHLNGSSADEMDEESGEAGPSTSAEPPQAPPTGPTVPTSSWLRFTVFSLSTLFSALSPLASHDSPTLRAALVDFLSIVVSRCGKTLDQAVEGPLEGLLLLAGDEWDDVRGPARRALLAAFSQSTDDTIELRHPLTLAARIVRRRLTGLPRSLRQRDEQAVRHGAGIVRSALELLPTFQAGNAGAGLLEGIDRWSWTLLDAIELERVPAAGRAVEGGMALAWITGADATDTNQTAATFPPIRLRGISESETVDALDSLWQALGRMAASSERLGDVAEQFLGVALGPRRGDPAAVTSLWVLDGVLRGARVDQISKTNKKVLRQTGRAVLSLLEELEEDVDVDAPTDEATTRNDVDVKHLEVAETDGAVPQLIVHKAGVVETPSLDEYKPIASVSSLRDARASQRLLLEALALRLLATNASLLGSSFQPFLMQALYHVLAHLSPTTHPSLRAYAQATLQAVSDATAYASPQNLVLANVDYVVNSVSQRLSVSRLEPAAPLVLVEMIRLVGKPIVPMVQDLVDDVFEALDDFHGYDEITVGLWAVLDALLKVMEEDLPPRSRAAKYGAQTGADADWRAFEEWYRTHRDQAKDDEDDVEEINPERPFESGFKSNKEREDGPVEFASDTVSPPTRPQVVTAQILSKAMYFLSHQSPFLRARVLSLIASAVPLLARPALEATTTAGTRASDLLPIIHRAWPFILNRLADSELFVVVEAAALIEALASHVGEFMARRILDDVWPRFRTLLAKQELEDRKSAISSSTRYSSSHRLYRSILRTLLQVARDVPLKEDVLWEQAVLARRFLSAKVDPELQVCASELYKALGLINPDAIWLVLAGTVRLDASFPAHLHMPNLDFGPNVDLLLEQL
ncbi:hypothetical protein NBRC10512_001794 [Rhodotorula toruloides]|uniref:Armadillo-type fold domain containing protein n=1 Tax=Rhodotorula toruloides (strain NP11) TaxID=1130832 RepID=M7XZG1_RHOT1|nr:Armadillo-type fold domain containing protein [Rhodotorula toruloides NP11]EMS25713.1 Armadillo-type fold domain containing protein [Rhodotorula toruloides NP11]KAJ8296077.1 TELO2-interacting protein 1 [Rhodotorula toruloides]